MFVKVRLTGEGFKVAVPEHYMQVVEAEKLVDALGNDYYEFHEGTFVGYPEGTLFPEYAVQEVASSEQV